MTNTITPTADQVDEQIERRLAEVQVHLDHAARALYGIAPGDEATDTVMANAYLVIGATANVLAAQLRGELR